MPPGGGVAYIYNNHLTESAAKEKKIIIRQLQASISAVHTGQLRSPGENRMHLLSPRPPQETTSRQHAREEVRPDMTDRPSASPPGQVFIPAADETTVECCRYRRKANG